MKNLTPVSVTIFSLGLISSVFCFDYYDYYDEGNSTIHYRNSTEAPILCDEEFSCYNNKTVRVCALSEDGDGLEEIARFKCPSSRPWCDPSSGTCVRNVVEFFCMRDGVYPDLNDCSRYYECAGGVPHTKYCPSRYPYYAPYDGKCKNSTDYCASYGTRCQGLNGVKVPIRLTNNMFAYCENSTAVVVDRCIGGYQFNEESQVCEPTCPSSGLYPSDQDCAQYYRCDFDGTITFLACPKGQAFQEKDFQCVDRTLVANCKFPPGFFN